MQNYQIKMLLFFGFIILFTISCTKDEENLELSEFTASNTNQRDENSSNQNGQGGPNGEEGGEVARLDYDIVLQWMDLFLELDRYATGMRPNATARALAYINLAAYETAQPGMPDFFSNSQKISGLRINHRGNMRNINWELALNTCYAEVINHFILHLPNDLRDKIAQLESQITDELSRRLSNRTRDESLEWGTFVAHQIIEFSQTDTEAETQILEPQPRSYEPPTGDGYWTYSAEPERALFPYWKSVRTFVISPEQTTAIDPIPYSTDPNSLYFQQMVEVYEANNTAKEQDNEALWIAEFWSDDVENLMFSPPARQISIANQLIVNQNMNLEEVLHLYLKLGFSLNDAAVSTWKYKYEYMVMRPNVFIHEFIDPTYQTNLFRLIPWPNPTFPGYPSGHSCFASAAAGVFIDFFDNQIEFTDRSHEGRTEFRGALRTFTSLKAMAEENAYSRIPLGVHIRMDCTEGLRLGYEISDAINQYSIKKGDDQVN